MRHDLFFFTRLPRPIDPQRLLAWADDQRHVTARPDDDGALELRYENADTGVSFLIDRAGDGAGHDGHAAGLALHLDYLRPTFFAFEAMALVEALSERFDLLVLDPQGEAKEALPCDIQRLTASWYWSNEQAVRLVADSDLASSLRYLPTEKCDALWRYSYRKALYRSQLNGMVFVPKILVFAPARERACMTAVTWARGDPTLFPPVDLVVLAKRGRGLFGMAAKESLEFAPAAEVLQAIAPAIEPFDEGKLGLLGPDRAAAVVEIYEGIESAPLGDAFSSLTYDRFVDVDFLSWDTSPQRKL